MTHTPTRKRRPEMYAPTARAGAVTVISNPGAARRARQLLFQILTPTALSGIFTAQITPTLSRQEEPPGNVCANGACECDDRYFKSRSGESDCETGQKRNDIFG